MKDEEQEPKECPFCGSSRVEIAAQGYTECHVYIECEAIVCGECHAQTGRVSGGKKPARRKMLITAWNTRAVPSADDRERTEYFAREIFSNEARPTDKKSKGGWWYGIESAVGYDAVEYLLSDGGLEKHPERDWYRFKATPSVVEEIKETK